MIDLPAVDDRPADGRPAGSGPADSGPAGDELADEVRVLGGSLAALPDGRRLVVTTRGVLEKATDRFTRIPFLDGLAARHGTAHIGFGVGRTAAEAEALARRAVNRARSVGPAAGVVSMTDDVDIVIDGAAEDDGGGETPGGTAPPGERPCWRDGRASARRPSTGCVNWPPWKEGRGSRPMR
ncbi:hypothetical protein [Streptomyces sp. I6]|uniref:hypothetical protein n=1 Tax=Streptomyces sp. I6 TaxID=2483113 RepID=UPI0028803B2E|nr:hypothetical protein [Streptomyces sp. I6]